MMGLLFTLFAVGLLGAVVLCIVPRWRWLAPLALIPVLGSVGAFALCWGLAISLEQLPNSAQLSGFGFFGGYVLGGLMGAGVGCWSAWLLIRSRLPR